MILIARAGGHPKDRSQPGPDGRPLTWRELPVLDLVPRPHCRADLYAALQMEEDDAWVMFTSPHSLDVLAHSPEEDPTWTTLEGVLSRFKLAAIGEATERSVMARGMQVDLVAQEPTVRQLVTDLLAHGARAIVWPGNASGDRSPLSLVQEPDLTQRFVEVYGEVPIPECVEQIRMALADSPSEVSALGFTSPEVARFVLTSLGPESPARTLPLGALGPVTAEAIRNCGVGRVVIAPETRIPDLAFALARASENTRVGT